MSEYLYRTEDIRLDEIWKYYVERPGDRETIEKLKDRSPVVLRGSRGIGKSMLLRMSEAEMEEEFEQERVLPVYLTFAAVSVCGADAAGFLNWMVGRISLAIRRALIKKGLVLPPDSTLTKLAEGRYAEGDDPDRVDILDAIDKLNRNDANDEVVDRIGEFDEFKQSIQDLCESMDLRRVVLLIDEATHVFMPRQQREFFSLMRALRSPYLAVKAAVYPGITSYGEVFQLRHDATLVNMDGVLTDPEYTNIMRAIVLKQNPRASQIISNKGELFEVLAFASMGNPRILLKTYAATNEKLSERVLKDVIRNYYEADIWAEHSDLVRTHGGYAQLIDWGREFIEDTVLPKLSQRNSERDDSSIAIWVNRSVPEPVSFALNILCYTGILFEDQAGVRATRSGIGTRYIVNPGCAFAVTNDPVQYGKKVVKTFSIKRMIEFGYQNVAFEKIKDLDLVSLGGIENEDLKSRLQMSVDCLDLSDFLMTCLSNLGVATVEDVIHLKEDELKTQSYVGDKRAAHIRNRAFAAVLEYLAG